VINTWAAHVLGIEATLFFEPTYASISRFLASASGPRSVASLNETAHLRGGPEGPLREPRSAPTREV
jgi:hypothetical protein